MRTSFAPCVQTGGGKARLSAHPDAPGTIAVLDQKSAIFFIAQSRGWPRPIHFLWQKSPDMLRKLTLWVKV